MCGRKSALHKVLVEAQDPQADLAELLRKLEETPVKTQAEADAICRLLKQLPGNTPANPKAFTSRLHALTGLFQDAQSQEAYSFLAARGIPELCRIFDQLAPSKDEGTIDDLLLVLKVLAMYQTEAGTRAVIRAARQPLKPDAYMWSVILAQYNEEHPHATLVLKELANPLPQGFLAVALLDSANSQALHGKKIAHPFDSPEGIKRLEAWLTSRDEDQYSYAHSATASLPFIRRPDRERLLALALDHPNVEVQLEGAWASAKMGSESGLKLLARYCLDLNYSERARRYLAELGREDRIPQEALAPDFQAKAEFASWLAHPNELGRAPDELEIIDRRTLAWPPDRERKTLFLIKYRVKDTTGLKDDDVDCGLVGSVTFCLFSYKLAQRPPEDGYAIHCYWEMENAKLIRQIDVEQGGVDRHEILNQWRGEKLIEPEMVCVAELSAELKYPQARVGLATARLNGERGWVVLDGPRSSWYPARDMPPKGSQRTVLMVHVGRVLLGFEGQPDRQKYLTKAPNGREPQQTIKAYEKLLTEVSAAAGKKKGSLLKNGDLLARHFETYIEAQVAVNRMSRAEAIIRTYETMLAAARLGDEDTRKQVLSALGPLQQHFEKYVESLISTGRSADVVPLIELFSPYWDHNLGYGQLGAAAFRCGRYDLAERYICKLRESHKEWQRSEEIGFLAEIWFKQGRTEEAHALLTECLKGVLDQSKAATGEDRPLFEQWFQRHRSTYLRLFPDRGQAGLSESGIPATTRR